MLRFYNFWVVGVLLLYYAGPIDWPGAAEPWVAVVVLSALLFFNFGARFGRVLPPLDNGMHWATERFLPRTALILIFVVGSAVHIYSITGKNIFNLADYSFDFGRVYLDFLETVEDREVSIGSVEGMAILVKSLLFPVILLIMVQNFQRRPAVTATILAVFVASSMMRGTDKEIFDIVLYLTVLAYYHGLLTRRLFWFGVLGTIFLFLLLERKTARLGDTLPHCLPGSIVCFDYQSVIAQLFGPAAEFLTVLITNYLTNGYEGLSRAVHLPFEFNWGLGHLPPVKGRLCGAAGLLCDTGDFQQRLTATGWNTRFRWTSVHTVIANDFHWVLTPVYFWFIGVIFGASERSWYDNRDYFSLLALIVIAVFMAYSSANMQIAIAPEWVVVYVVSIWGQAYRLVGHAGRVGRTAALRAGP